MSKAARDEPALIGAVASALGVSVRTLHHWDAMGVASPSGRTDAGYRVYLPAEVARLRRVLLLRELGVPLDQVAALLEANADERREELGRRREQIAEKIRRLQGLADDVDRLLAADASGVLLSEAEQATTFGPGWDPAWAGAARERWGDSAQWAEYAERSSRRSAAEWGDVVASLGAVTEEAAAAMRAGVAPGDDAANAVAERHRAALGEYFYCTHSMHVLVARGYAAEQGFIDFHDGVEPGLAAWLSRVVDANALANGVDPDTAAWE